MNEYALILLNMDGRCKGQITWQRKDQQSVIDFVIVNGRCYKWFEEMIIDEDREKFDLSDHNMITVSMKIPDGKNLNFTQGKEDVVEYYKTDEETLKEFAEEVCKRVHDEEQVTMEVLNRTMKDTAEEKLKARYIRRVLNKQEQVKEPPWMTKEIRKEIKRGK